MTTREYPQRAPAARHGKTTMSTLQDERLGKLLDELARGTSLERTLEIFAEQVAIELTAPICKVWVVKRGDICDRCPLAYCCTNRQMCMHLVASSGALAEREYPRIPLSVFDAALISRGGSSSFDKHGGLGEKLFALQGSSIKRAGDSFALHPLRGAAGIVGLVGVYNHRTIASSELGRLSGIAPLAAVAINIAQLHAREELLRKRLAAAEAGSSKTDELRSLRITLAQTETELAAAGEEVRRATARVLQLEEGLVTLRDQNRMLVEGSEELERSRRMAEDARSRLESARAHLEIKVADLTELNQGRVREMSRIVGEHEQLVNEVERLGALTAQLEATASPLSLENEHLRALNQELSGSVASANERAARAEAERDSLSQTNSEMEEAIGKLQGLASRLEDTASGLKDRIEAAEHARGELEQINRRLTEENRRLNLEGRSRARFLANISHELRTPMNAIIGFTSLLYEDPSLQLSERHRRSLERVSRNARDLLELINNVLDLSKIEAGRMDVFSEAVEVGSLIDRALAIVEPLKEGRPLKLLSEVEPGLPAMRTDRTKLQQILINLLSNAVKFTPQGQVKVIAARAAGDRIRISVADTGVGIAEEHLPKIFQEFQQVGGGRSGRSGTGLGLAITRRLIELLGGEIAVSSNPGEGSVFAVTLPVEIDARPAPSIESETAPDPNKTALVIDGDPASLFLTKKYLGEAGYSVATTDSVARGQEISRMAHPAVVTVDMDLPEVSPAILTEISRREGGGVLIAVSGDSELESQALGAGAHVFLKKPVNREALSKAIERARSETSVTILIVDDNPDTLELVTAMVDSAYETRTATNGREALEEISRSRPDVIVLDLMLPEMDGFEVVQRLSLSPEWRDIPVILLTARDLSYEERRALDIGTARILQKGSVSRDELLGEIGMVLKTERGSGR
jgi:signal transduction histidine kinase/DNA-binding response OmpR family regulator